MVNAMARRSQAGLNVLWFNLAVDEEHPTQGFAVNWIRTAAGHPRVDRIYVVTMRRGSYRLPANVHVYSVGKEKGYSEPRRALEFYRILTSILSKERVDAAFCHMIPIFAVLSGPLLRALNIPLVMWFTHPSVSHTLKWAHAFSNRVVTSLTTSYPYRQDKVMVLGHGIDTHLFAPDGPPEEPPIVLCVGRLSPVKDHPTLIQAAALLRKRLGRPFRVVILGSPPRPEHHEYAHRLKALVHQLALDGIVQFHPAVPNRELPSWYRRCTVHVNLTATGSGDKVTWEAMACGRVAVAANEGYRESFGVYADRLLFEYGNPNSLAEKLEWVLTLDLQERRALERYLRRQVEQHHSLDRLIDKLVAVLAGEL